MKKLFALLLLSTSLVFANGQSNTHSTAVRGYTKRNGTYVEPSHRTAPNRTQRDNYNTKGNTNPFNGKTGTRTPRK